MCFYCTPHFIEGFLSGLESRTVGFHNALGLCRLPFEGAFRAEMSKDCGPVCILSDGLVVGVPSQEIFRGSCRIGYGRPPPLPLLLLMLMSLLFFAGLEGSFSGARRVMAPAGLLDPGRCSCWSRLSCCPCDFRLSSTSFVLHGLTLLEAAALLAATTVVSGPAAS